MLRLRDRRHDADERFHDASTGAGDPESERLNSARQQGRAYASAADDAINRALSANSEAFLQATQQIGGE